MWTGGVGVAGGTVRGEEEEPAESNLGGRIGGGAIHDDDRDRAAQSFRDNDAPNTIRGADGADGSDRIEGLAGNDNLSGRDVVRVNP